MSTYWTTWISNSTSATTTGLIGAWGAWTGNYTTTGATSTLTGLNTWITWTGYGQPILSEEEQAERRASQEQARIERQRVVERERIEAQERATALLTESLDEEQKADFEATRSFTVVSADGERVYKVRRGWSRNVDLIRDGRKVRTYCIHPRETVPEEDNMLAQKLLLETDEAAFLRVAIAS